MRNLTIDSGSFQELAEITDLMMRFRKEGTYVDEIPEQADFCYGALLLETQADDVLALERNIGKHTLLTIIRKSVPSLEEMRVNKLEMLIRCECEPVGPLAVGHTVQLEGYNGRNREYQPGTSIGFSEPVRSILYL